MVRTNGSQNAQSNYSSRIFLNKAGIYFLLILTVVAVIDRVLWADVIDDILEGLVFLGVALFIASRKPFEEFFFNLPRPHKIILPAFISFMVIGQLLDLPRKTFPFVSWTMYGRAEKANEVNSYSYRGITRQGEMINVNPVSYFPSLAHGRMALALEKRIDSLLHSKEAGAENPVSQRPEGLKGIVFDFRMWLLPQSKADTRRQEMEFAELLIAIGKGHNQKFPHRPINAIEVIQTTKDITNFFKDPQVKKVFHAALERDR